MSRRKRSWLWVLAALVLAFGVRARLLDMPLVRDEGDYAYNAQLLLDGVPPYRQAYDMRMPGIFAAYAAVLWTFGETDTGIRLGLALLNAATALLLFLLGRRLLDESAGVAAAIAYAALTLHPGIRGIIANTEHFVLLPAVAGLLLVLRGAEEDRAGSLALGGACLALAFLTKQPAALWLLFGAAAALRADASRGPAGRSRPQRLLVFCAGAAGPLVAAGLALAASGVWEGFWYWTLVHPFRYGLAAPLDLLWETLVATVPRVVGSTWPLWLLAGAGLLATLARPAARRYRTFVLGWLLVAALSVAAGLRFRPTHFLLLAPVVSLLVGVAVSGLGELLERRSTPLLARGAQVALLAAALLVFAWGDREVLLRATPREASRLVWGGNPFPESIEIARFIRANTQAGDRIAVLGSEPQIYFYARRRSATPYILTYDLMLPSERARTMQLDMIRELEEARPALLVFVNVHSSWLAQEGSPRDLFEWYRRRTRRSYLQVGRVEIRPEGESEYLWGAQARSAPPADRPWIALWRRRG
jgi:hypothetical protein